MVLQLTAEKLRMTRQGLTGLPALNWHIAPRFFNLLHFASRLFALYAYLLIGSSPASILVISVCFLGKHFKNLCIFSDNMTTILRFLRNQWRRQLFFEWGGQRRAKKILGRQVSMVANSAFSQRGTHTPILTPSQVPFFLLTSLFLFAFCGSFPFPLSFIPISCPSPPFIQLRVWGSAVSSPSGSGRSPAAKCN